ncbi:MAG TPA: DUF5989 family protein [Bryobacterales bacterium]|nr:DUF5989 family protein [Bryobacterales bacterium]
MGIPDNDSSGFLAEFWHFLRHNKAWWLTPIILLLLILGALVVLGGSGEAPFIYKIF